MFNYAQILDPRKFSLAPLAVVFGFATSAGLAEPVFAQSQSKPTLAYSGDTEAAKQEKIIVGSSMVLVIDSSSSVDATENAQMHDGIISALLDPKVNYTDCVALTAVHYADRAYLGSTHIVCTKDAMETFVAKELAYIPGTKPNAQYNVGSYTNISAGFREAENVFTHEKAELGIYAMKRSIVFIGDGHAQKGTYNLFPEIVSLAKRFGATSYAIPIADHQGSFTVSAQKYYVEQLVTPASLTYKDQEIWGDLDIPIPPGQFLPADNFTKVKESVLLAMGVGGM
jgi:hypothetical protein